MTVPPVIDFSPDFGSSAISSAALLGIVLSGLALVLAWVSASGGGLRIIWHRSWSQPHQHQQLSSRLYQDTRPIAVFVFENFSAASSSLNNNTNSNNDISNSNSNSVTGSRVVYDDTDDDVRPLPRENDADMQLDDASSISGVNDDGENADSGDLSDSTDASHRLRSHGNTSSNLAAYDIDVLESDGELDAEMRGRVQEVLLEYTMVMEAKSDADLRNRRLKYFNCLLDSNSAQSAGGETGLTASPERAAAALAAASATVSTASTQTSCSSLLPLTHHSISPVPADRAVDAEEAPPPHLPLTLRLRLKYFNDNQRTVFASPVETIASFKRKHFALELSQNQSVRLIYNGRELKDGENRTLTLASYALPQDATIHCLVLAEPEPPQTSAPSSAAIEDFGQSHQHGDIGGYMFPLFLAILALIWYCRVYYKAYFNFLSTMAMCAATLLLCAAIVAAIFSAGEQLDGDGGQIRVHRINLDSQPTTVGVQRSPQRRDASSMTV